VFVCSLQYEEPFQFNVSENIPTFKTLQTVVIVNKTKFQFSILFKCSSAFAVEPFLCLLAPLFLQVSFLLLPDPFIFKQREIN
jgi:hypothetical protein